MKETESSTLDISLGDLVWVDRRYLAVVSARRGDEFLLQYKGSNGTIFPHPRVWIKSARLSSFGPNH